MPDRSSADFLVDIDHLTRRFGSTIALGNVSLSFRKGLVYGLVGSNGAGKSTLLKHILGLLKAHSGSVRVFGLDPAKYPVEVLGRIGYLSEDRDLPEWMRIGELLRYTAAFHPHWDWDYANELLQTFQLNPTKKVKDLSKGMRAQAGLIVAVAHRPELLLLDEPSTGLDAVVRKDILNAIIRTVADDGRTAIFSSHLLDEVELMSDELIMMERGKIVLQGATDSVKQEFHVVWLDGSGVRHAIERLSCVVSLEIHGKELRVVCRGDRATVESILLDASAKVVDWRAASLQEVFVAKAGRNSQAIHGETMAGSKS